MSVCLCIHHNKRICQQKEEQEKHYYQSLNIVVPVLLGKFTNDRMQVIAFMAYNLHFEQLKVSYIVETLVLLNFYLANSLCMLSNVQDNKIMVSETLPVFNNLFFLSFYFSECRMCIWCASIVTHITHTTCPATVSVYYVYREISGVNPDMYSDL